MSTVRVDPQVGSGRVGSRFLKIKYGESGRVENSMNLFFVCRPLLTTLAEFSSQCLILPYGLRARRAFFDLLCFKNSTFTASTSVGRVGPGWVSIFPVIGWSGLVWSGLKL